MSTAEQLNSISYDPQLEARHAGALKLARTSPWEASAALHDIEDELETAYSHVAIRRLHLARLKRDKALLWAREKTSRAYDTRAYRAAGLVHILGSSVQELTASYIDIKDLTNKYAFTDSAQVELDNQIAASRGHIGRIMVAHYCILEKYPECQTGKFQTEDARTQILAGAAKHLRDAYSSLEYGVHNSYFMASIAGNALRTAIIADEGAEAKRWKRTVVMHRNRALQNISLPDKRRALLTSVRLQWESRSRNVATNAVLLGNI